MVKLTAKFSFMEEWKEYQLKDVTTILGDGLHGTPKYDENGTVFFINGNNLVDGKIEIKDSTKRVSEYEANKYRKNLTPRTILVSINGTIGNVAKYKGEACILGKSACYFNVADNFDLNFIYYVIASQQFKDTITHLATGTTIKNVSLETMRNYSFMAPSINEQKRISSILSSFDDKIELNRRINDNLEQQAQALFKAWFVDNAVIDDASVSEYFIPLRGKNLLTSDAKGGEVPVVAGGLTPSAYHNVANTKAPVITISASGANAGYVNLWGVPVWSADSSYIDSSVTPHIYFWYNLLKFSQKNIFDSQTGSAQPHIYPKHIGDIHIPNLDLDKVADYNKIVTPIYEQITNTQKLNMQLTVTRDTLLPKLMSGEIKI